MKSDGGCKFSFDWDKQPKGNANETDLKLFVASNYEELVKDKQKIS